MFRTEAYSMPEHGTGSAGPTGKRMLVLCPHPVGVAPGQRLKFEQYYPDWQRAGWDITVSPFADRKLWAVLHEHGHLGAKIVGGLKGLARRLADLARTPHFDLVYCFMYVTPIGTALPERLMRALSRKLLFDIEDNVLAGHGLKADFPNPLLRMLKSPRKAR